MLLRKEISNTRLLFTISLSITALALYLFNFTSFRSPVELHRSAILNVLFINITFLGSGIFCCGLILYLFYKNKNTLAKLLAAGALLSAILVQIAKNYLHNDGIQIFFEREQYLFNSQKPSPGFISAHAAIVFTLSTILSLYFKNRVRSVLLFMIAGMVAYSRIYLGTHTIADLFAGAFIGLGSGTLTCYFYLNYSGMKRPRFVMPKKISTPEVPLNVYSIE